MGKNGKSKKINKNQVVVLEYISNFNLSGFIFYLQYKIFNVYYF